MACTITDVSLIGIRDTIGEAPDELVVSGTLISDTGEVCTQVRVHIVNESPARQTETKLVPVTNGQWNATFTVADGDFTQGDFVCADDQLKIDVVVTCSNLADCEDRVVLNNLACELRGSCPQISDLTVTIPQTPEGCNADGTVTVTVSATATPGNTTPVLLQWIRDGEEADTENPITASNTPISYDYDFPAGQHTVGLEVIWPQFCSAPTPVTFTVPECEVAEEPCPTLVYQDEEISELCNEDNERTVTLEATLTGPGTIEAELVLWDSATASPISVLDSGINDTGTLNLSFTGEFAPGTHFYKVVVLQPANCNSLVVNSFDVESCTTDCPTINYDSPVIAERCDPNNTRQVSFKATLTQSPPDYIEAELVLWDSTNNTVISVLTQGSSSSGTLELETSESFASGTYEYKVRVIAPRGCDDQQPRTFTVAPCVRVPPEEEIPDPDPPEINWCLVAVISSIILLGLGGLLIGIGVCVALFPAANPATIIAGVVIAVIGVLFTLIGLVILVLFLIFCVILPGVPAACPMMLWLTFLLDLLVIWAGVLAFVVAVISMLAGHFWCAIGFASDFAFLGLLAALMHIISRLLGCEQGPIFSLPNIPAVNFFRRR